LTSLAVPPSGGGAAYRPAPARGRRVGKRWAWVIAGGLVFGALAGYLGTSGSAARVMMLAVVLLPLLLWKRPYLAPAVLLSAAVLVEQSIPGPRVPITDKIPMFQGVGPGHLQGSDILLLMVLVLYLVKGGEWGPRWVPRTHVSLAIRCVLACVLLAVVIGQAHHGDLRVALMEARPYVYLAVTYFVASVFIRDRRAIRALLWAFVGTVGFKAVQGIYVWILNRHMYPKPESYISHEASYFFVIFMVLVLALWLFDQRGKMRTWATRLLPLVIFANTVNDRRASWEMLGGALLCFGVIAYKALPIRRRLLGKAVVGLVLISAVYFPVMWNNNGSLGEPARAVKSQIAPSTRDADSDTYRVQENANLELNIKQDGLLGKGFGVKIDYALPITDISQDDPLIAYIPHNDVLDVLMRMGLLGGLAMWGLIAAGIISGFRLAMSRDRELAVVGMVLACSIVAYALMGAVDQGFFFFRIAFITGTLLGLAEAARRLDRAGAPPPAPHARMTAGTIARVMPRPRQLVVADPARQAPPEPVVALSRRRSPLAVAALTPVRRPADFWDLGVERDAGELSLPPGVAQRKRAALEPSGRWRAAARSSHVDSRPRTLVSTGPRWNRNRVWIWDTSRSSWREGVVCATVALGSRRWIGYWLGSEREDASVLQQADGTPPADRLTWVSTSEVGAPKRR
jgi:hypothetical protein